LDGTLHQTWSRVGVQPRVDTYGQRKTAHVFGCTSLEGDFIYRFAPMFDGHTFHEFLLQVVEQYTPRKVFMVIDNGPCHWLDDEPEFNPVEGVWKCTRKRATHNRFYRTTEERDAALTATFEHFKIHPAVIDRQVARFR
jgi:hypothetical protein